MFTGINVPLEAALLLCAGFAAAGAWLGQQRANRRLDPRRNPLHDLMRPAAMAQAIDLATRRNAARAGAHAVLHARIDQLGGLPHLWHPAIRDEVRDHVAAVMRASLRRDDRLTLAESDGFTILIPGADERAAVRIADRLRRSLSKLRLPQFGGEARLTASFGVAADRFGDTSADLGDRAQRALDAAMAKGEDHVVPASEIEELMLLPAPVCAPPAASAA